MISHIIGTHAHAHAYAYAYTHGHIYQSYLEHVQVGLVEALFGTGSRPGTGRLVVGQDDDVGGGGSPVVVGLTVEQK